MYTHHSGISRHDKTSALSQERPRAATELVIASPPDPTYASDPRVLKLLVQTDPLEAPGDIEIVKDR